MDADRYAEAGYTSEKCLYVCTLIHLNPAVHTATRDSGDRTNPIGLSEHIAA